ncbi:MAG: hypothetical protein IMF07_01620 [Proteobacteria bacterium]|nr:hypothetical protein [Pseudomonadota bacterium]
MSKPSVGGLVATSCTKCKLELEHTIMAMVGDKIVRVKCRTCGSEHNYKDKTKKEAVRKRTTASAKRAVPVKNPERAWEEAMNKVTGADIPYDGTRSYKPGEVVAHPIFGSGVVLEASEKKVAVIFKDKARKLVSGN